MANLAQQLAERRNLRNSAKRLLSADVEYLKHDVRDESVPARMFRRAGISAQGVANYASDHKVALGIAAGVAVSAAVAWHYRDCIEQLIDGALHPDDNE